MGTGAQAGGMSRWAEAVCLGAAAAAVAASVALGAGAPRWALSAAAALSLAAGLAAVTRASDTGRLRWLDGPRLVLLAAGLWSLGDVYRAIGGDGYEYFALLRSPILDFDFDFANDFAGFGVPPVRSPRGEITVRVAMGVSLFWLPWFLAAHLAALVLPGVRADGFGPLYQAAVTTGTCVYALVALAVLERVLRGRFGRGIAALAVLALLLATPLHFYATANAFMSHGVQVFAATATLVLWLRARGSETPRPWLHVGVAGGLTALVRPQDAVLLLIPLLDLLWTWWRAALEGRGRAVPRALIALLAGPAVLSFAQLLLWFTFYGPSFVSVVREANWVAGTPPQVSDFLFAARKGLLTWTPLYAVALLGWLALARRDPRLFALFAAAFFASVLVNSTTIDWWGSDAFGQRRMLSFTPLFGLGLGAALAFARRRPLLPAALLLAALAAWNLQFEAIYNAQIVAGKGQAVDLERLAAAQLRSAHRTLVRWHGRLPARVWALFHDNLNGVWLDEGSRHLRGQIDLGREPEDLPLVVGHGWYEPQAEPGADFRLSKGWRSWLRVPVRTPGALRATLRARRGVPDLPVQVRIEVNGHPAGAFDLAPDWTLHVVDIPAEAVVAGLNDVALIFSATPRRDVPGYHGKDAAAALDRIAFARLP